MARRQTAIEDLITVIRVIPRDRQGDERIAAALGALDERYNLSRKISQAPGLKEIIEQLMGRIHRSYGGFDKVAGQRILDIACGSNTSKAPPLVTVDTPSAKQKIRTPNTESFTAIFEPWFCRVLIELGADPVGLDRGSLDDEIFVHYNVDLGQVGALNFLPDDSFDAVQDSRLFGSPEFTAQFPNQSDRLKIAEEIRRQELRLLKAGGIVIHSDAANLLDEKKTG